MVDITRIDKITRKDKAANTAPYYSDFYNNLNVNPFSKKLVRYTNEEAVTRSIKNLILTNKNERLYKPELGSSVSALLFEPMDSITADRIRDAIANTIKDNEPRARVNTIEVIPNELRNAYDVYIYYEVINSTKPLTVTLTLYRVR